MKDIDIILEEIQKEEADIFHRMYDDYLKCLEKYSKQLKENKVNRAELINEYMNDPQLIKYFAKMDGAYVGFSILQWVDILIPPAWYIVEFYVVPEHRRKGIGTKMFEKIKEKIKGDFFFYILKKNGPAKIFWKKMTKDLERKEREDIAAFEDCETVCFSMIRKEHEN